MNSLYSRTIYRSPFEYLLSQYIYEYDLSKANISALLYNNIINNEQYENYLRMDKLSREISIGNLTNDNPEYKEVIKNGITEAKRLLCVNNNIKDEEIFEIRNDAIFILNRQLQITQFGHFKFNMKNIYNSFLRLNGIEIFHGYNPITNSDVVDVKGIDDEIFKNHINGWIPFLCEIFYMISNGLIENALTFLNQFYEDFINKRADLEMYREFNSYSMYRIEGIRTDYFLQFITEKELDKVSIKDNLLVLRDLHSILSTIYFQRRRK